MSPATFAAIFSLTLASFVHSAVFDVTVGGSSLRFNPESVNATTGDIIHFTFQGTHTATQSTLANPCVALSGGFDSGEVGSINYTVTSTNATWFHCTVPGHCQAGMVFAVNPGSQFSAFQSAAMGNTSSSSTPSSSNGTSHTVIVGSGLTFSPSNITASPGDTVTFDFQQGDHSATQSTFAGPCQSKSGGFDSGYLVNANYSITVNDTNPIWVYCKQGDHCAEGMVFAINAPTTGNNTFSAFKASAMGQSSSSSGSSGGSSNGSTKIGYSAGVLTACVAIGLGLLSL
ncbi:hypothetical protein SCLCIDRAFT_133603 [Scleroderma citrinum Foug A]|uniref:Phytocyanin domain-containing protein n=1 Tax=Scleroderma citrinum Foug A TaxID=1036808 RepID=A0A0C2ZTQ8_9AGAM|nr:hypothetical protein SCLCIDRAFT_133603 [Scleroderma citrinum Foug A]